MTTVIKYFVPSGYVHITIQLELGCHLCHSSAHGEVEAARWHFDTHASRPTSIREGQQPLPTWGGNNDAPYTDRTLEGSVNQGKGFSELEKHHQWPHNSFIIQKKKEKTQGYITFFSIKKCWSESFWGLTWEWHNEDDKLIIGSYLLQSSKRSILIKKIIYFFIILE